MGRGRRRGKSGGGGREGEEEGERKEEGEQERMVALMNRMLGLGRVSWVCAPPRRADGQADRRMDGQVTGGQSVLGLGEISGRSLIGGAAPCRLGRWVGVSCILIGLS